MDAKLTIHFRKGKGGTTLATAVMVMAGSETPKFYRVSLAPDVDPWSVYNEVATRAVGYILSHKAKTTGGEKPAGAGKATQGKLVQFQGVLPT